VLNDRAIDALAAFQDALVAEFPGLQARRYRRIDEARPELTLMERYSGTGQGLEPELAAVIVARSEQVLAPWCEGGRHVETFARLDR
jgi:hypothetical protein